MKNCAPKTAIAISRNTSRNRCSFPGSDCGLLYSGIRVSGQAWTCSRGRLCPGYADRQARSSGDLSPAADQTRPAQKDDSAPSATLPTRSLVSPRISQQPQLRIRSRSARIGRPAGTEARFRAYRREEVEAVDRAEYREASAGV